MSPPLPMTDDSRFAGSASRQSHEGRDIGVRHSSPQSGATGNFAAGLAVLHNTDPGGGPARRAAAVVQSAETSVDGFEQLVHRELPAISTTGERFRLLAEVGAADLSAVRLLEGHLDALSILDELGGPDVDPVQRLGVWASKAGGHMVSARPGPGGWCLDGSIAYCSGASSLDAALVVADCGGADQLFLVDLHQPGVAVQGGSWPAVGMAGSISESVDFERVRVPADTAVGGPGDYVGRPGFWAGAIGVAACWAGGALGVARVGLTAGSVTTDPHRLAHLGAVASTWLVMWSLLVDAAGDLELESQLDFDQRSAGEARAQVVRHQVESGCQRIIEHVGRLAGPGPLVADPAHARRVPDLLVYLRQHHGEADLARLGSLVVPTAAGADRETS